MMLPGTLHKRFLKDAVKVSVLQSGKTLEEAADRSSQATTSSALGIGLWTMQKCTWIVAISLGENPVCNKQK